MAVTIDGTNGITSPDFEPSSSTVPTNGLFLPTTNALGFATNSTERLRLDASGNLGIGTNSPQARLHVLNGGGASSGTIWLGGTTYYGTIEHEPSATGANIYTVASASGGGHIFKRGSTEQMRIDSSGNLLVGTTDSSATTGTGVKIKPNGDGAGYPRIDAVTSATTNAQNVLWEIYSTGASAYRFYVGAGGTIFATSGTITAISDQRLKENIRDLDDGLSTILALKPRKFDWKEGKGKDIKDDRGFIAQEFEQVFPDLIDTWKDPAPEGEEPYKSVRPDLIPVLVKAIQELTTRLEALENK